MQQPKRECQSTAAQVVSHNIKMTCMQDESQVRPPFFSESHAPSAACTTLVLLKNSHVFKKLKNTRTRRVIVFDILFVQQCSRFLCMSPCTSRTLLPALLASRVYKWLFSAPNYNKQEIELFLSVSRSTNFLSSFLGIRTLFFFLLISLLAGPEHQVSIHAYSNQKNFNAPFTIHANDNPYDSNKYIISGRICLPFHALFCLDKQIYASAVCFLRAAHRQEETFQKSCSRWMWWRNCSLCKQLN